MPVNYQQMHASNQEIIDFFQDEQVVADLLEQFNQVADDYNSDSDSDYQEESDYQDGEISEDGVMEDDINGGNNEEGTVDADEAMQEYVDLIESLK
jgi:hypothetical protein